MDELIEQKLEIKEQSIEEEHKTRRTSIVAITTIICVISVVLGWVAITHISYSYQPKTVYTWGYGK